MVDQPLVADRRIAEAAGIIVGEDIEQHAPGQGLARARRRAFDDIAEPALRERLGDRVANHAIRREADGGVGASLPGTVWPKPLFERRERPLAGRHCR